MIKLYIANLGKYNEGILHGAWITLPVDPETFQEFLVDEVGIDGERYEEYAIHDYETRFGITIGEYDDIEKLSELAESLKAMDEYQLEDVEIVIDAIGCDLEEAIVIVESGNYLKLLDIYDEETLGIAAVDDGLFGHEIPEELENYIDYESIGRNMTFQDWTILPHRNIAIICY